LDEGNCRLGDECKHLHVHPKVITAGQTKYRRER
jgi:hypothetical protein